MSARQRLRAAALRRVTLPGVEDAQIHFWLKPIVSKDMLTTHRSFLAAVLPPAQEDRMLMMGIEEEMERAKTDPAALEGLKALQRRQTAHIMRQAMDADLQGRVFDFNVSCICAAVVGMSEDEAEMTPIRLVMPGAEGDGGGEPELVPLDVLPEGAMEFLSAQVRTMSFGGEAGGNPVERFRGGRGDSAGSR